MAAVIGSPEDLKVQQRINSESLSAAFEQSLSRGGEDFSLAGRETGLPEVTQPIREQPPDSFGLVPPLYFTSNGNLT